MAYLYQTVSGVSVWNAPTTLRAAAARAVSLWGTAAGRTLESGGVPRFPSEWGIESCLFGHSLIGAPNQVTWTPPGDVLQVSQGLGLLLCKVKLLVKTLQAGYQVCVACAVEQSALEFLKSALVPHLGAYRLYLSDSRTGVRALWWLKSAVRLDQRWGTV